MTEENRASSSFAKKGDRKTFTVELRPGETTIVSWKKLVKDANKSNGSASASQHLTIAPVRPLFFLPLNFTVFFSSSRFSFPSALLIFTAVYFRCDTLHCSGGVIFGSNFGFGRVFGGNWNCCSSKLSYLTSISLLF